MSLTNIESSQVFDVGGRLTSGRGSGAVARCFLGDDDGDDDDAVAATNGRGSGSVGVFSLTGRPHNAGHRVISYCPLGFLLVLPDILTLSINQPLSLVIGRNKLCD